MPSLAGVDLSNAEMSGVNLSGIDLTEANLAQATLVNANLVGSILRAANLNGVNATRAQFQSSVLAEADLTDVVLLPSQLGGADLTSARLPTLTDFDGQLQVVNDTSKTCRTLFLSSLAACTFCLLTITETTDRALILDDVRRPLPIIGLEVSILGFYYVAPALLFALFVYFQLYLQALWERVTHLPARFPDGRAVDEAIFPWMMTRLIRLGLVQLKSARDQPQFLILSQLLSLLLGYAAVPLTMRAFWGRALARHDQPLTYLHVVMLSLSVIVGLKFVEAMLHTLGRGLRLTKSSSSDGIALHRRPRFHRFGISAFGGVLTFVVAHMYTFNAMNGTPLEGWRSELAIYYPVLGVPEQDLSTWDMEKQTGVRPDLRSRNFVEAELKGTRLSGAILRSANLTRTNLRGADLTDADLTDANLTQADLQNANMTNAILMSANMAQAKWSGANMMLAYLPGGDLRGANLVNVNLVGSVLGNARLRNAELQGANLCGAWAAGIDLSGANVERATLYGAVLSGADLRDVHGLWNGVPPPVLPWTPDKPRVLDEYGFSKLICAEYSARTKFPDGVSPEDYGMFKSRWEGNAWRYCRAFLQPLIDKRRCASTDSLRVVWPFDLPRW